MVRIVDKKITWYSRESVFIWFFLAYDWYRAVPYRTVPYLKIPHHSKGFYVKIRNLALTGAYQKLVFRMLNECEPYRNMKLERFMYRNRPYIILNATL